ncbi:unnamed protein product, partial [Angiostrongylus costaricensis]|uniref:Nonsense-mediated mRNA decay factor SMG8 n=1 Tax=Angiostrongylus costaricensis TaxID=334426 RepID=A0A158PEF6_ANGCS
FERVTAALIIRLIVCPKDRRQWLDFQIQVFYCVDTNAIFMILNGYNDFTHLRKTFSSNPDKNFFEKFAESEEIQVRLLHFISIFSHIIVFVESNTRFDISLSDMLSIVNKVRKNVREDVSEILERTSKEATEWIREGRIACPRILFAFQRNIIRNELGCVKKVCALFYLVNLKSKNHNVDGTPCFLSYSNSGDLEVAVAIAYLDAVLVGDRDEAIAQVRAVCDNLWQGGMRGCEQVSMTGNRCQLKVHPAVGDASVDPSSWEMHSNDVTYLSTCSCGRRQAVRKDPFTLKVLLFSLLDCLLHLRISSLLGSKLRFLFREQYFLLLHSYGLRDQPNLKLGGEYLYPVTVQLEVRENFVVKLFIGMEYECPRGHRFFVAENGEPLRVPKNSNARTAMSRESDDEFLHCDFPLRRQCTCRKLPVQAAQLMRIHVVTPKAPITVTIQPAVELPGQEGCFGTGEAPLQLSWARYYILQLPFIYSGPSGVWIPPAGVERVGTFKKDAIQVKYIPMLSKKML